MLMCECGREVPSRKSVYFGITKHTVFFILFFHLLDSSVCIFTLYFPCFAFFVIGRTRKQTLLIKRFNFAFTENRPPVIQSNVQAVTDENEEQYILSNIRYIKFQNCCFLGLL